MKRPIILLFSFLCILAACSGDKQKEPVLLKHFVAPQETHPEWSELFTDKYAITPLETTSECLIGQIDKIKKFRGHYYISSTGGQSILHFNEQGKFVAALNKIGNGPEEFHRIEDFDVYEIEGNTEVWVSDNQSLKVYDAVDFSFKYKIAYPFTIYKFRRLENSHILLVTGNNEKILTVTDKEGKVLLEYLKKEIPFLMFRPVQFVAYGVDYLYQLGLSNAYIAFDSKTETFRHGRFFADESYLSDRQMLDLFNEQGNDFLKEVLKGSFVNNILSLRDIIWIHTCKAGENYFTKVQGENIVSTRFEYGTVLSTFSEGDSDDSVLMYINPDQLSDYGHAVLDKFGNKIECGMEDNPCLLEFF